MTSQTYSFKKNIGIDEFEQSRPLMYPDLSVIANFPNPILINGLFYYKSQDEGFVYYTKDKTKTYMITDIELCVDYTEANIPEKYRRKYLKLCEKQKALPKRITKLNGEIQRIIQIKKMILTDVINNLNFKKSPNKSHNCDVNRKLIDIKSKSTLFLYDVHNISPDYKIQLQQQMEGILNIKIVDKTDKEKFYVLFSICRILMKIDEYICYLNSCIKNVNEDNFRLNKKYWAFNDISKDKIEESSSDIYSTILDFHDRNIYAIDNLTKCKSNGYVLSKDRRDDGKSKWHLYPRHENDKRYKLSEEDINNFIEIIRRHEEEGIEVLKLF